MHKIIAPELWLGLPAPRYTSYPPATQFRAAVAEDGAPHLDALKHIARPISLYLHIPFCRELCLFCGCHQVITKRADRTVTYLTALHQEIELVAGHLNRKLDVAHIHFGGGSPSTLLPEQMSALMALVRAHFNVLPTAEIAIELDPRTTTQEFVHTLAQNGFNRASLGVQDFNPVVQETIHRVQSFEMVAERMAWLRAVGITALSLDLMYGLPHQTPESLATTAEQALRLNPQRISLFSYAHVPSMKPYQKALAEAGLPSDVSRIEQEATVRAALVQAGYIEVGIDHFAQPQDNLAIAALNGTLNRNFQGYTDDDADELLAFGASGISDAGAAYVQNEPDLPLYQTALAEGRLPLRRICTRVAVDHKRAGIIRDLMCNFTTNLADYGAEASVFAEALAPFIAAGLARVEGNVVHVDKTHRMAVRVICTLFDDYYNPAKLSSKVA